MTEPKEMPSRDTETTGKLQYAGTDKYGRPLFTAAGLTTTLDRWLERFEYAKQVAAKPNEALSD